MQNDVACHFVFIYFIAYNLNRNIVLVRFETYNRFCVTLLKTIMVCCICEVPEELGAIDVYYFKDFARIHCNILDS